MRPVEDYEYEAFGDGRADKRSRWVLAVLAALFALCLVALTVIGAFAHEAPSGWSYSVDCCSNKDCRPIDGKSVYEGQDGYTLPSGEVLAYSDKRIRRSGDDQFHWCVVDEDAGTRCLYVPPRSF